jgi:hypothetical protein
VKTRASALAGAAARRRSAAAAVRVARDQLQGEIERIYDHAALKAA